MNQPANVLDCRDWRGVEISVGVHVVWPTGGHGSYMKEGVVEEILFTGRSYNPFKIKVLPLATSGWQGKKPRRQWLESLAHVTVIDPRAASAA